nr:aminoglycoside phosphotransferase family protein [Shewanella intestini]
MPAALLAKLSRDCVDVSLLSAGLSNQNFRLHCREGDKVLRVNTQASDWCNRQLEIDCWQQAHGQKLAPALLWYSPCYQFYISEFIEQPLFNWSDLYCEKGIESLPLQQDQCLKQHFSSQLLAGHLTEDKYSNQSNQQGYQIEQVHKQDPSSLLVELLTRLHQLPVPKQVMSVTGQYQQYLTQLQTLAQHQQDYPAQAQLGHSWQRSFTLFTHTVTDIKHWLATLEQCLIKPCFCHRDLSPFNILLAADAKQQKLVCIDFEYAVASHPLFDLASVLATHSLSRAQYDVVIEQYIGFQLSLPSPNLTGDCYLAVDAAINLFWTFAAMWALLMLAKTADDHGPANQVDYQAYFEQYLKLIGR